MCNEFDSNLNEDPHSPRILKCEYLVIEVDEDDGDQPPAVADDTGTMKAVSEPEDLLSLLVPIPSTGEEVVLLRLSCGSVDLPGYAKKDAKGHAISVFFCYANQANRTPIQAVQLRFLGPK